MTRKPLPARLEPYRAMIERAFRPAGAEPAGPGEESVWDYPRPPILQPAPGTLRVLCGDTVVAQSDHALEMKETAGAPVPYFPPEDVRADWLVANARTSHCEWKGIAHAYDLVLPSGERVADAAFTYRDPHDDLAEGYGSIAGWFGFYPAKLACFVGEERARPQPGGFYAGWVTDRIKGPVKGEPGSDGW